MVCGWLSCFPGVWRALSPELRDKLQADIVDAVADNAMPLLAVRTASVVTFLGDAYPDFLVRHGLALLGRDHPSQPGRSCLSILRVSRCLGRQLLAACRERAPAGKAGVSVEIRWPRAILFGLSRPSYRADIDPEVVVSFVRS